MQRPRLGAGLSPSFVHCSLPLLSTCSAALGYRAHTLNPKPETLNPHNPGKVLGKQISLHTRSTQPAVDGSVSWSSALQRHQLPCRLLVLEAAHAGDFLEVYRGVVPGGELAATLKELISGACSHGLAPVMHTSSHDIALLRQLQPRYPPCSHACTTQADRGRRCMGKVLMVRGHVVDDGAGAGMRHAAA